jgi:hypothetical protein
MKLKILLLAILMLFTVSVNAGPKSLYLTNVYHWAGHHKFELLVDASMFAASAADVESSYRSQHQACNCVVETNPFLGPRPSRAELWGVKLPFDVGLSIINHYTANAKYDNGKPVLPYKIWALPSIGWDIGQIVVTKDNISKIQ